MDSRGAGVPPERRLKSGKQAKMPMFFLLSFALWKENVRESDWDSGWKGRDGIGKGGAVGESVVRKAEEGRVHAHGDEVFAVEKGPTPNAKARWRDVNGLDGSAGGEGLSLDGQKVFGQVDSCQGVALGKCQLVDDGDGGRQFDVFQFGTPLESAHSDASYAVYDPDSSRAGGRTAKENAKIFGVEDSVFGCVLRVFRVHLDFAEFPA